MGTSKSSRCIFGLDAAVAVELDDEEGVIKGSHHYLLKRYPLDELEREVYQLLKQRGPMPLSAIWRSFDCHLWEICAVLKRLKQKGLAEESAIDVACSEARSETPKETKRRLDMLGKGDI